MSQLVSVLHDSILAGSGVDVEDNWFETSKDWYDGYNFITTTWIRLGSGGKTLYECAPLDFVPDPSYILTSRPEPNAGMSITYALDDLGSKRIIIEATSNMIANLYIEPNPSGYNDQSDESMDILTAMRIEANSYGADITIVTPLPRAEVDGVVKNEATNVLSDRIRENYNWVLDQNRILGDGTVDNYQLPKYFTIQGDRQHYGQVGHDRMKQFNVDLLDRRYNTRG